MLSDELVAEIKRLSNEGWSLCVGCLEYSGKCCAGTCDIETRKFYGLSPEGQ